ncbi:MAG: hypothetical protein JNL38_17160 [Myxococcales bacterium]|nr:hypothetical protein [Myxococcales bacterium]
MPFSFSSRPPRGGDASDVAAPHRSLLRFAVVGLAVGLGAAACGSDPPKNGNGVNDVAKACAIRASWTRASTSDCSDCQASAPVAACDCPRYSPYGGRCEEQGKRAANEPDCTEVFKCIAKCNITDCRCIEACYVGHDVCKTASAARDGCVAEACDATCK